MKTKLLITVGIVLCMMVLATGCDQKSGGGSATVDETKPLSEVKAEADKLDVEKLKAIAMDYKEAIMAKEDEVKKLMDQIKEIPLAQQMTDEAKSLQADLKDLNDSLKNLTDRFQVYYNKLKEMNADLTGLEI